jgi:C_GCAxxG_C_C family probable redox protein
MTQAVQEQAKTNALARFAETGPDHINCAQAVLAFALEVMDQDPDLVATAGYFGGGIGGMGEACGAVTGAALALGLRDCQKAARDENGEHQGDGRGDEKGDDHGEDPTRAELQAMLRDFSREFGTRRCAELTGHDLSTPEGMDLFRKSEIRERCSTYVSWVCDRIAPLLTQA